MTTPPYEAPASDTVLPTFDGRVLELSGFGDAHRRSFLHDAERLDALRAFAEQLARGVAERRRL
ncbi:hypothetical protein ACIQI8_36570 [Streptomyces sp. NPDC092369]|uniref:hypothetical protein n=1 Tax=Streptomyces sp. NPDC092369 TaxID=3366015 RepID=UPI0037F42964